MEILVLTISDRASRGEYDDRSGPAIEKILAEFVPGVTVHRRIVPDEADAIRGAFSDYRHCDFIVTTGGTGLSARDITPETTEAYCDRLIPGIAEHLRAESMKQTSHAMLSRGVAGQKGTTIIVNFPGSVRAAEFCTRILAPVLGHASSMLHGGGHPS